MEIFETMSGEKYICTQWFYRAKDTVRQPELDLCLYHLQLIHCDVLLKSYGETILTWMVSGYKGSRLSH